MTAERFVRALREDLEINSAFGGRVQSMIVGPELLTTAQDGGGEVQGVRGLGAVASPKLSGKIEGFGW
jgi:hypothetical protein